MKSEVEQTPPAASLVVVVSDNFMANENGAGLVKWLAIMAVLGLAGAGAWYWKHPADKKVDYKTTEVDQGDLVQVVTATGQLNPVTNVQVGCQISGIIDKIFVDYNSKVTNGQLIARIDPATYQANVAEAAGDVSNAQATLELSVVETKRAEELHKASLISQSDYDKAVADLHQSQATLLIKQATLQKNQVDLDHTLIYAPVDGIVISRNVDVGQTVAASFSAPTLFVIANDLSRMQIDALVSESDVGGVETNERVNFSVDAFPTRTFHGTVVQVRNAPQTNQNVITYDTVIGVNNADLKLKPGMTANVSIVIAQTNNVLKIRNSALRFHPDPATNGMAQSGGQKQAENAKPGTGDARPGGAKADAAPADRSTRTVYVPVKGVDGKIESLKQVQIKTGINDGIYTQVVDGLKEGDEVVIGLNLTGNTAAGPSSPFNGPRRF
jgi:HlyD family secretion protein